MKGTWKLAPVIALCMIPLLSFNGECSNSKEEKLQLERTDNQIAEMKKSENYYGEATVEIKNYANADDAENSARAKAKTALTSMIKSRITIVFEENLKSSKGEVEKNLESKTKVYANALLHGVAPHVYRDYPKKGRIYAIAIISKTRYQADVESDIREKKESVLTPLREGIKALNQGNIVVAINNFITSNEKLQNDFGGTILNEDVDGDGTMEEVGSYLSARLNEIMSHVEIMSGDERVIFDNKGNLNKRPVIQVRYVESDKENIRVNGMPLVIEIDSKQINVNNSHINSDMSGQAIVPINNVIIDGTLKEAVINITIDVDALKYTQQSTLPVCTIKLSKAEAMGYCANILISGAKRPLTSLDNSLRSILLENGYSPVSVKYNGPELTEVGIEEIAKNNLDYLVVVTVSASGTSVGGGYEGMSKSYVESRISILSMPSGNIVAFKEGPSVKGYGQNLSDASLNAYSKVSKDIVALSAKMIKSIK